MRKRLIIAGIIIPLLIGVAACPGPVEQYSAENVTELAESLQRAGLGQTRTSAPATTNLSNVQADGGIVLEGDDLEVEIYRFSDETKLILARTAVETERQDDPGILVWSDYLFIITKEPENGHVRRTLEVVIRGEVD